ncbi:MAG: type II toxin-antitoxin system PemK/MazF family toxin [Opitutaceae bacterium]|jgi:mRNA interferase MazF
MSLINCAKHDVVLLPIPFTDLASRKVRPAVVAAVFPQHGDVVLVPITSQVHNTDVPLADWKAAGLNVPCGIKAQIATLEQSMIVRRLGQLSDQDKAAFDERLTAWFQLKAAPAKKK